MRKIVIAAAFVFAAVTTQQAFACDWGVHAAADRTIVACDGSGCRAIEPATTQQQAADASVAAPQVADEPASPAPTTVADCTGSNC
jgi:hypothetical protein